MTIKVALVDDHALIRQGLWRALERARDMTPVGEAATLAEADTVIRHLRPDVAVVDIRLPDGSGLDLCQALRQDDVVKAVVVVSMYGEPSRILSARDAGASGFVSKDAPATRVVEAIRSAHANPSLFIADGLAGALSDHEAQQAQRAIMTPREREVLQLIAEGLSVAEVSRRLTVSESTTKTHLTKIYAKLGAHNRAQALIAAIDLGLVRNNESY